MRSLCCCFVVLTIGVHTSTADELSLRILEEHVKHAIQRAMPATVALEDTSGTGVVIQENGLVLTAAHIFRPDHADGVTLVFSDGRKVKAQWLGRSHISDLGVLKISDEGKWPFVEIAATTSAKRGEWCLALGHPFGYTVDRKSPVVRIGRILHASPIRMVTDCAVCSGDSGGPTIDLEGNLIGIHSQIGNAVVENWDVPIARAKRDWATLISAGQVVRPHEKPDNVFRAILGAELRPSDTLPAVIASVDHDSPAAKGGLTTDDVILAIDDEGITHRQHCINLIEDWVTGGKLRLRVKHNADARDVVVTLRSIDAPSDVSISSGLPVAWAETDTRSRANGRYEKNHADTLRNLGHLGSEPLRGIVAIMVEGEQVSLGTVIDNKGTVVTKASEISGASTVQCVTFDGAKHTATVQKCHDAHDVAILSIDGLKVTPLPSCEQDTHVGDLVFCADERGHIVSMGLVAAATRSLGERGHLGVAIEKGKRGVVVTQVRPGSTADVAGLVSGDRITAVGNHAVADGSSLSQAIRKIAPGQKARLAIERAGKAILLTAAMKPVEVPEWFRPQEIRLGAIPSRRLTGFPSVLTHDIPLTPEQCGGPLVNREGKIVAINIARHGRVESFAIPIGVVRKLVADARSDAINRADQGRPRMKALKYRNGKQSITPNKEIHYEIISNDKPARGFRRHHRCCSCADCSIYRSTETL